MNLRGRKRRRKKNSRYCGESANAPELTPPLLMGYVRGVNKNESGCFARVWVELRPRKRLI
jgi:hypothetical protein